MDQERLELIRLLLARLERISADSYWAHRTNGIRGAMLRMLQKTENGGAIQWSEMKRITGLGFDILERAATELYK